VAVVRSIGVVVVAFGAMEPLTAATHRFVMHGIGDRIHRSHHRVRGAGRRWEANDAFPLTFATLVLVGMFAGFNAPGWGWLVPAGIGVTAYGAAYAVVHDVYVHGRLRWFDGRQVTVLDRLAAAHRIHHRYGAAPFGMLLPVVPSGRRRRADRGAGHQSGERVSAVPRT
jgi:beta-carotene 3-hydroxylase